MKKYLLFTGVFLVLASGCSKKGPEGEKLPELAVVEKIDESKPLVYVEIPENAKDLNDYRDVHTWLDEDNMNSETYPYLKTKKQNGGTERVVLNFKSSDAEALQIKLDENTHNSLKITDEYLAEPETGETWSSFQVVDLVETDEFVSFTVLNHDFIFYSDASSIKVASYVFEKTTGSLIAQDDLIKRVGFTTEAFDSAFLTAVEAYNATLPEDQTYATLIYKPKYFEEGFDFNALTEEESSIEGLYVRPKPEEGVIVNEDGSLNVIYEIKYLVGLNPGSISYGLLTILTP